jgi:hypothetical protein
VIGVDDGILREWTEQHAINTANSRNAEVTGVQLRLLQAHKTGMVSAWFGLGWGGLLAVGGPSTAVNKCSVLYLSTFFMY